MNEPIVSDPPAMTADEAISLLHETERMRMKERDAADAKYEALTMRVRALYHNCMSSACFAREDACKAVDAQESNALRRGADAFNTCAGWLRHITL